MVASSAELRALSATQIASGVTRGELGAGEVVEAHCRALDELARFNALITPCADQAIERARQHLSGPLAGVPIVVKDLFNTAGVRTTYGSRIYANHVPDATAVAVELLERAGAVMIAKANLHEFAWGTTSQNPHWGYVASPTRPGHVAGGSSGGNAAALAAGVGVLGLGTDTAGSLRIPSACCDTVGFKPPHGVVPGHGCLPLSPTFDVAGPMARTVADCALAYSVLSGAAIPEPRLDGLVIGVLDSVPRISPHDPGAATSAGTVADITGALRKIEALGARLVERHIDPPEADLLPIMLHEAAVVHNRTFPSRRNEYGLDTQLKFDAARGVLPADVDAARRALPRWREHARGAADVHLYVSPTLAGEVPRLDVWEPDVRVAMVANTRIFSFVDWPAIAIGGLQLAGPDTAVVLGAALAWERAYGMAVPT